MASESGCVFFSSVFSKILLVKRVFCVALSLFLWLLAYILSVFCLFITSVGSFPGSFDFGHVILCERFIPGCVRCGWLLAEVAARGCIVVKRLLTTVGDIDVP